MLNAMKSTSGPVGAVTAIAGLLIGAPLFAQDVAPTIELSFKEAPLGLVPAEFEPMMTGEGPQGQWEIISGQPVEGNVLAQTSSEPARPTFPMLVYEAEVPADVAVTIGFKPVSGQIDQAGGVVMRLQDENNYYIARANTLENNVRFYRVEEGQREQLASANVPVEGNEWHTLTLRAQGNEFAVQFDGQDLLTATDDTFGDPGRVGFWTKADSVTHLNQLTIEPLNQ